MMNHTIRREVDRCSMIVWKEDEQTYRCPIFASGQFTASCFFKDDTRHAHENLELVASSLIDTLGDFDNEFREEHKQRVEIKKNRMIEAEQRRRRMAEQQSQNQRRTIIEAARRQERDEARRLAEAYSPPVHTIGSSASLKLFDVGAPGAPRFRRFRTRTQARLAAPAVQDTQDSEAPQDTQDSDAPAQDTQDTQDTPQDTPQDTQRKLNWGDED